MLHQAEILFYRYPIISLKESLWMVNVWNLFLCIRLDLTEPKISCTERNKEIAFSLKYRMFTFKELSWDQRVFLNLKNLIKEIVWNLFKYQMTFKSIK